ncbi:MAG: peptidase M3, partial [Bacteroidota bacterium]
MNSLKLTVLLLAVNLFITCDINKNNTDQLSMTKNPLLTEWETPFGVPPFNAIKNKHYLPAIKEGINSHQKEIDVIVNNKEEPNFVNIIEAIELSGVSLKRARNVFNAVNAAHTNDTLKATAKEIAPLLASHRD